MQNYQENKSSFIEFMATNHVAVNLLSVFILLTGLFFVGNNVKKEVFPAFSSSSVIVSVSLPQANPEQVEQGVVLPIENAVSGLDGIKKIDSSSYFGYGVVKIDILSNKDSLLAMQEIKSAIDGIYFPTGVEPPTLELLSISSKESLSFAVYGDKDILQLRKYAGFLRDKLLQDSKISSVKITDSRVKVIGLKIKTLQLEKYNITIDKLAQLIKQQSINLSAGSINTNSQEIFIKTQNKANSLEDLRNMHLNLSSNTSPVALTEIVDIKYEFKNRVNSYRNLKNAVKVSVYSVGNDNPVEIANVAKNFILQEQSSLPDGVEISVLKNTADIFAQRLDLMVSNAITGILLVLIIIGIFLEPRLSFWVMLGIPSSILGAFIIFGLFGISINMITLFAFIITLGVVVDDAVIVGEYIYRLRQEGKPPMQASVMGIQRMVAPVSFAVITNMVSFAPMLFLPGDWHVPFMQIPLTVIAVLAISFIECVFILPAHLSYSKSDNKFIGVISKPHIKFNSFLQKWLKNSFRPLVEKLLRAKYKTLIFGFGFLLFIIIIPVMTKLISFSFFPQVASDTIFITAKMKPSSSMADSEKIHENIIKAQKIMQEELSGENKMFSSTYAQVSDKSVFIISQMSKETSEEIGGKKISKVWLKHIVNSDKTLSINISSTFAKKSGKDANSDINILIYTNNDKVAKSSTDRIKKYLLATSRVNDIQTSFEEGKREINVVPNKTAQFLGISRQEILKAVRNAIYGYRLQYFYENKDRVEVKLGIDMEEDKINDLKNLLISHNGEMYSLGDVAILEFGHSKPSIDRVDGVRRYSISANMKPDSNVSSSDMKVEIEEKLFAQLRKEFTGIRLSLGESDLDMQMSMKKLKEYFIISILVIYSLLAVAFKSYSQPIAIMLSIPFGIAGSFIGHILLGVSFGIFSFIGIVALAGVVINTGLLLIDSVNKNREEMMNSTGNELTQEQLTISSINAVIERFRAIAITSLTTFFGIIPIVFETSKQAQFLVPMAVSLSFGVLFSSLISLFIVPSFELAFQNIKLKIKAKILSLKKQKEITE
jgi:multidrug efflux pump subunit AcrB